MKQSAITFALSVLFTGTFLTGCAQHTRSQPGPAASDTSQPGIPANMHLVQPLTRSTRKAMNNSSPSQTKPVIEELQVRQGNYFSYALPPGWKVGEDGQFALTMVSADNKAMTVMVGNSNLMPGYPPQRYVYETLMALRPNGLTLGQAVRVNPVKGFQEAYQFHVAYQLHGGSYAGEAVCHVNNFYGGCVMAITAALSEQSQWTSYASWLPQVSRQISATNGAAFGMRGAMQQNLQNSIAYGEAARAYREWSAQKWQQVTDERNNSVDRQNYQFRENLGAINTYHNPYNAGSPLELSTQYKYYWIDQQGRVAGTNDPSVDPNHGSTNEWKPLQRKENP